jgi:hypothetical protein
MRTGNQVNVRLIPVGCTCILVGACAPSPEEEGALTLQEALQLGVRSAADFERMREYVADRYPTDSVRHSFTSTTGKTIDCVDYDQQPGLANLPLREGNPPPLPSVATVRSDGAISVQTRTCVPGTVPIVRLEVEDLAKFETLDSYFQKSGRRASNGLTPPAIAGHEHAVFNGPKTNWGGYGRFGVWKPSIERSDEFSLGQIWVAGGHTDASTLQTVEAGWHVFPQLHPDAEPHLFTYWTPNNYDESGPGCYNQCEGWVQNSPSLYPGILLTPVSVVGNEAWFDLHYSFCPEPTCGGWAGWWVGFEAAQGLEWVGYYPASLFSSTGLRNGGSYLQFGGEVYVTKTTSHSTTDMGSGAFPSKGRNWAASIRNVKYIDTADQYISWAPPTAGITNGQCYTASKTTSGHAWAPYLLYGGRGYGTTVCQ